MRGGAETDENFCAQLSGARRVKEWSWRTGAAWGRGPGPLSSGGGLQIDGPRRSGASASPCHLPLSPSAGAEASCASRNDIGRSANQARGCSEGRRTPARQGSPAGLEGRLRGHPRRAPRRPDTHPLCPSVHLRDFRISPERGPPV